MTGLDKMKNHILEEAKAAAGAKVQQAEDEAARIIAGAKADARKEAERILKKGEEDVRIYKDKLSSSNDLMKRTMILSAKQGIIAQILKKAYEKVTVMDPEEYFEMLSGLAAKYVRPREGKICFSKTDLERLPESFMEKAGRAATEKGGSLTLCDKPCDIAGGFILIYGGVEENCTLKAMFDSKKDELSDAVRNFLFA